LPELTRALREGSSSFSHVRELSGPTLLPGDGLPARDVCRRPSSRGARGWWRAWFGKPGHAVWRSPSSDS
jgi:hypothetical protein